MQMEVKSAQLLPPQPNQVMQCVVAGGQMDPDGKGMQFFSCMMSPPSLLRLRKVEATQSRSAIPRCPSQWPPRNRIWRTR